MSRSYRYPMWVNSYGSPSKHIWKRFANKAVRQKNKKYLYTLSDDLHDYCPECWNGDPKEDYNRVPDGMAYKKFSDRYNIVDSKHEYDLKGEYFMGWSGTMLFLEPDPKWKAIRK